jgi:hypothetical protein
MLHHFHAAEMAHFQSKSQKRAAAAAARNSGILWWMTTADSLRRTKMNDDDRNGDHASRYYLAHDRHEDHNDHEDANDHEAEALDTIPLHVFLLGLHSFSTHLIMYTRHEDMPPVMLLHNLEISITLSIYHSIDRSIILSLYLCIYYLIT